jgi:DNA-binding beta-propeller fold protein YncE
MRLLTTAAAILLASCPVAAQVAGPPTPHEAEALRDRMGAGSLLGYRHTRLAVIPPREGWQLGLVSWIAAGRDGETYLLHRGQDADPIVAINDSGRVLRSWGKGLFVMPHGIRVDPDGNVWTTDAASSMVRKFRPDGTLLMTIEVGGQPSPCRNNFCSTTDIGFGPNGRLFVADGYANGRVVEYTHEGRKVREWGSLGTGPGQMRVVHSIVVAPEGVIYVADRENGRIQRFDLDGNLIGTWTGFGKTFSLALDGDAIWLTTQPRNDPNFSPGWLAKVDRATGTLIGYVDSAGGHGLAVTPSGDLLLGPGPELVAAQYRRDR